MSENDVVDLTATDSPVATHDLHKECKIKINQIEEEAKEWKKKAKKFEKEVVELKEDKIVMQSLINSLR